MLLRPSSNFIIYKRLQFSSRRRFGTLRAIFPVIRLVVGAGGVGAVYTAYKVEETYNSVGGFLKKTLQDWIPSLPIPKEKSAKNDSIVQPPADLTSGLTIEADAGSYAPNNNGFSKMIRKMMEVRAILKSVDKGQKFNLPNVVVIGSQSSGKSSVLEAIVGHEFLPKGSNMVTRRPLELNLINCPDITRDYAEFPNLGLAKMHDFAEVQKTIERLNLAVADTDCISDSPIELNIYSQTVPDLSLVDLPGYIQVVSKNQPPMLREKIHNLCERYISSSNVILAISAADVDLANSESLKACKRVDPEGKRTIGVITKLDLVEPQSAANLLSNGDYPLPLGYVGVICKDSLERKYLESNHNVKFFTDLSVLGIKNLQSRLTGVLETFLRKSVTQVFDSVETDLEECRYQFKVLYNDRPVSAEAYVSNVFSMYKQELGDLSSQFGRTFVRHIVRSRLETRWSDICNANFWSKAKVRALDRITCQEQEWINELHNSASSLTKSGIGRVCTQGLFEMIESKILFLMKKSPFCYHGEILSSKSLSIQSKLKQKLFLAIDQVENSIKPLKNSVEFSERDWDLARRRVIRLMHDEIEESQAELEKLQETYGIPKLVQTLEQIRGLPHGNLDSGQKMNANELATLVAPAKRAGYLHFRMLNLNSRLKAIEAPECALPYSSTVQWRKEHPLITKISNLFRKPAPFDQIASGTYLYPKYEVDSSRPMEVSNILIERDPYQSLYPEVYLYVLLEKALSLTSLYVYSEIVQDFLEPITYSDDLQLFHMNSEWIKSFALQNPSIAEQLLLQERKEALEKARFKLLEMLQGYRDK